MIQSQLLAIIGSVRGNSDNPAILTLSDANKAYLKIRVCKQVLGILQGKVMPNLSPVARQLTADKLMQSIGYTDETKTLANSYLDGDRLSKFAELAKRGVKFREYRNLKSVTPRQTVVITGPSKPTNKKSQVTDIACDIARANHLLTVAQVTDDSRKQKRCVNKASKLIKVAELKDVCETAARDRKTNELASKLHDAAIVVRDNGMPQPYTLLTMGNSWVTHLRQDGIYRLPVRK